MQKLTNDTKAKFIGQIIDLFENYLTEKGIILENEDRDEAAAEYDPDEIAIIYGRHYDCMEDVITGNINHFGMNENPISHPIMNMVIREIITSFKEICEDGGYADCLSNDNASLEMAALETQIRDTFERWELLAPYVPHTK